MLLHLLELGRESGNTLSGDHIGIAFPYSLLVPGEYSRLCDAHRTGMLAWADEEVAPQSLVCEEETYASPKLSGTYVAVSSLCPILGFYAISGEAQKIPTHVFNLRKDSTKPA